MYSLISNKQGWEKIGQWDMKLFGTEMTNNGIKVRLTIGSPGVAPRVAPRHRDGSTEGE